MTIRILNAEPDNYSDDARRILRSIGHLSEERISQRELADKVKDYDVLIVRLSLHVSKDVLSATKRLKVIVSATTGLDHIDLKTASEKNISVLSLKGETRFLETIAATPEHTWALLLALVRRIPWAYNDVVQGKWDRDSFRGNELRQKRLGLLGLGRVGRQVANYGSAFGMTLGAYDPYNQQWPRNVDRFDDLKGLLRWSQILSIHVPLNEQTKGLLNEQTLRLLPRNAWLINTSRGAICDEQTLVNMLSEGKLGGAAVDVLDGEQDEKLRSQSPLLKYIKTHDNLLISPHLAGATIESMRRTEVFVAEKLAQWRLDNQLRGD